MKKKGAYCPWKQVDGHGMKADKLADGISRPSNREAKRQGRGGFHPAYKNTVVFCQDHVCFEVKAADDSRLDFPFQRQQ